MDIGIISSILLFIVLEIIIIVGLRIAHNKMLPKDDISFHYVILNIANVILSIVASVSLFAVAKILSLTLGIVLAVILKIYLLKKFVLKEK